MTNQKGEMKMSTDTKTIDVISGGPIEGTFHIDLSAGPGAYEFRGARGTGKTTCISSIDWLAGHKVDVTLHDGAVSGRVEGFGVVAPIGGRKRRKGDLELDTIDAEKFSLTDLIDPPGKTPEVRDAHAIKALAVLSESTADATLYYALTGGQAEFDALGISPTLDPVLLATRIKTAFDKRAREMQNTADAEAGHAAPLEVAAEGVDLTGEEDAETLQGELEEAIKGEAALIEQQVAAELAKDVLRDTREKITAEEASYTGATSAETSATLAREQDSLGECVAAESLAAAAYTAAKQATEAAQHRVLSALGAAEAACDHERLVAAWKATIENSAIVGPTAADINAAKHVVYNSRDAVERGVRIRDAKQNQEKAKVHREAEKQAEKQANELRNKAGQVFDILAQSLHTEHLEIHAIDGYPRLFVQHPRRGRTAFDQVNGLSDGERVDFTLRELLPHITSPGLLPIPQRVWQDLQPSDRTALHELAVKNGLFLFGAQVDDGELRVVYLGSEADQ